MKIFATFILAIFSFYPLSVFSELRIDITKGNLDPIPIAILKFNSNNFSKDNRTSFNVFNRPVLFENQVSIKFDLSFYNKIFIGNILTLIFNDYRIYNRK